MSMTQSRIYEEEEESKHMSSHAGESVSNRSRDIPSEEFSTETD